MHIIGHLKLSWWPFCKFCVATYTNLCKLVATCTRREVATLLWTLSRRRRAFLGPGNTFYLFVLLIFETWKYFFGTWKYFLSFLSSHFWDLDIRFNVFFLLRRKTFSKCTPLGTLHLFMGKYCIAFHFEGGMQKWCSQRKTDTLINTLLAEEHQSAR